ncbi:hypothetical protein A2380_03635 [candidate division WWE3 bacterium RIFOXYB1_FULL_43_24]|uniref:Uncharacterized protein n=2 Tax=Katanobacteria TaxID=422282 RepID=A0A0G1BMW7_UNCKA|nr:MAG: hypothetical protein UU92_C0006G0042 [candidate division WWE3 bacterium GW2011_GWA1_42_12]KKS34393.1 MAG: hypothetical protein UU97_C0011G0029 [candidate division WWE3 bacterium GW2011_GWD1_42_14]KKS38833.1 MAG: hypothetical protein UV00_C0005G0016 [candidate division WWE3 bacterium GW2011_GWF1_42_14]KKS40531.1 MAG: hypothetical protein UV03_C0005G0017 [candidate division WWE3 bacterium GW2011_GWE1_42_16]KKS66960.1 MAG: hypothetical protein UV35_C0005G0041 [candidate division WWE3 bacte
MSLTSKELINGFKKSYYRTKDAKNSEEILEVYYSLFETLNWVVAIDYKLCAEKNDNKWFSKLGSDGDYINALRFARNRTYHQWFTIFKLDRNDTFPAIFPMLLSTWKWCPLSDIPSERGQKEDPNDEKLYVKLLANRPVKDALVIIDKIFSIT